jgi:hypothetical protein
MLTRLAVSTKFQNAKASKACLRGVQDSLGGAKTREFSRPHHSPSISSSQGGLPCRA